MFDKKQLIKKVLDAWNSHDLNAFMDLHSDNLEWTSPMVAIITAGKTTTLVGKDTIKPVWQKALDQYPDIHHEIRGIFEGADSVAVRYYSTAKKIEIIDVMYFDEDGKVRTLNVYYE